MARPIGQGSGLESIKGSLAIDGGVPETPHADRIGTGRLGTTVKPGTPTLVCSFTVTNWGGVTSAGLLRFGLPFARGDVAAGNSIRILCGTTPVAAQFDERTSWSDGSLRFAVAHGRFPSLSAGESRVFDVWTVPGGTWSNVPSVTLAAVAKAHSFQVHLANLAQNSVDPASGNAPAVTKVGSGGFTADFATHAAVSTRVTPCLAGPVCDGWLVWGMAKDNANGTEDPHLKANWYVDAWKNPDGSIYAVEVGAVMAQDWWSVANPMLRTYDATLVDGAVSLVAFPGVSHPYKCQWLTCVNDGSDNRGRRPWVGGAIPTLLYQPDRTYWRKSGLVPPLDLSKAPSPVYVGAQAHNNPITPCTPQDHRGQIDGTGAYAGRGIMTNPDCIAFMRQTSADTAAARVNGLVGLHTYFHWRSNRTRLRPGDSAADVANTPISLICDISDGSAPAYDFTAQGMPMPVHAYSDYRTDPSLRDGYTFPQGGGGEWSSTTGDSSHQVNYCGWMYKLEGERYLLEALLDLAVANVVQGIGNSLDNRPYNAAYGRYPGYSSQAPATVYGAIGKLTAQERSVGWSLNLIGDAAAMVPDSHVACGAMRRLMQQQGLFLRDSIHFLPPDAVAAGVSYSNGTVSAPWMQAMTCLCSYHAAWIAEDANVQAFARLITGMTIKLIQSGIYKTEAYRICNQLFVERAWDAVSNPFTGLPRSSNFPVVVSPAPGGSVLTFDAPTDYIFVQNGDVMFAMVQDESGNTRPTYSELREGVPYYVGNVANGNQCTIGLTPGGAPIVFNDNPMPSFPQFCVDPAGMSAYTVAANPPHLPNADDYAPMHGAVTVMAYRDGHPQMTLAMVNRMKVFLSQVDVSGWMTWAMAL